MFCLIEKNNISKVKGLSNFVLYENDTHCYLPRYIKRFYPEPYIKLYQDQKFQVKSCKEFKFTSPLRESQEIMSSDFLEVLKRDNNISGIAHARPGAGKTVFGIYMAHLLNVPTLIVIDTRKIVEQWKEEIITHTDLTLDDIGLIKGDVFDVENKVIIITTPQTLASKFKNEISEIYPQIREIGIGLIVWDECHKIADKWASGAFLLNSPNIIGLSATPFHTGDKSVLMHSIFGDIESTYGNYDFSPEIKFVKYDSNISSKYGYVISKQWDENFNAGRAMYNKAMTNSDVWKRLCADIMVEELKDDNNRMLVLVQTKKQLETLFAIAEEKGLNPVKLFSEKSDIDKSKDRLIIATLKYATEAFDYAQLNRLLLAVPLLGKKSLIQAIGRILRSFKGKTSALVIDLIDIGKNIHGIFDTAIQQKLRILNNEYDNLKFSEVDTTK